MALRLRRNRAEEQKGPAPRVVLTWALLGISAALLVGKALADLFLSHGDLTELASLSP